MSYCYSYDGELYQGEFDNPLAAAAEVFEGEPHRESVHVGESVHAPTTDYVSADWIIDDISCRASDEVGEVADDWLRSLSKNADAKVELEKLVADFIDKHERPTFWKVENVRQVTRAEVVAAGLLATCQTNRPIFDGKSPDTEGGSCD
jgi:hypothetical protein